MYVYALELPPELVAKLHTSLRIVFFMILAITETGSHHHYKLSIIKVKIDTNGLYGINAYDVLVMSESRRSFSGGHLTTEQIDTIVKFVEGGGGLIVSNFKFQIIRTA
jgi:hypothetical protein